MSKFSQSLESSKTKSAPKEGKFLPGVHVEREKKKGEYSKETSDALAEERI